MGGSMRKIVCDVCEIPTDIDQIQIEIKHECCEETTTYYFAVCQAHARELWNNIHKGPVDFSKVAKKEQ